MSKTYDTLKELMFQFSKAESMMIDRFLREMDDVEFSKIPKLLLTSETKKVLDMYAFVFYIKRKDGITEEMRSYEIYSTGTTLFIGVV